MSTKNNDSPPAEVHIDINNNPDYVIERASADDLMYIEWGIELLKQGITFANEYLRHLITLNVAVVGLYITLVDKKMINLDLGNWIMGFFFLSLFVSFIGILPTEKVVCVRCPEMIKKMTEKTYRRKSICIWFSSFTFFIGLLLLSTKALDLVK